MGKGCRSKKMKSSKKSVQKSTCTDVPSSSSTTKTSPLKSSHEEISHEGSHAATSNKSKSDANNTSNLEPNSSASGTLNEAALYAAISEMVAASLEFPPGLVHSGRLRDQFVTRLTPSTCSMNFPHFPKYTMADGNEIKVDVIDGVEESSRLHSALYVLTQDAIDDNNMVVGFDTEFVLADFNGKLKLCVWLIKLCTSTWCLLIKLDPLKKTFSPYLQLFLSLKDIIFVGLHLKEDLKELYSHYGLIVRNAVDLSELAANVLGQPRLVAYGIRDLAREVLSFKLEQRPLSMIWAPVWTDNWTPEHDECAATDTYALYKIGTKLLVDRDEGSQ